MEQGDFIEKKCNSGKNIQFKPKGFAKLELKKAVSLLEALGAEIEIETPSLLIFRIEKQQIDMNANGKTIVKTEDREKANACFSKIFPAVKASLK